MKYRYYIPQSIYYTPQSSMYLWRQNKNLYELSGDKPDNWTPAIAIIYPSQDLMDKFEVSKGLAKLKYPNATIL